MHLVKGTRALWSCITSGTVDFASLDMALAPGGSDSVHKSRRARYMPGERLSGLSGEPRYLNEEASKDWKIGKSRKALKAQVAFVFQ